MKIEILGPGCPKCKALFKNVEKAIKDLCLQAEVTKIEDIEKIVGAGVMMTPALVVDGKIISTGKILSVDEIKKVLQ